MIDLPSRLSPTHSASVLRALGCLNVECSWVVPLSPKPYSTFLSFTHPLLHHLHDHQCRYIQSIPAYHTNNHQFKWRNLAAGWFNAWQGPFCQLLTTLPLRMASKADLCFLLDAIRALLLVHSAPQRTDNSPSVHNSKHHPFHPARMIEARSTLVHVKLEWIYPGHGVLLLCLW